MTRRSRDRHKAVWGRSYEGSEAEVTTGVTGGIECEECGSDENAKTFHHFDQRSPERLCWDCRWPHIKRRLRSKVGLDEPESDEQPTLKDWL